MRPRPGGPATTRRRNPEQCPPLGKFYSPAHPRFDRLIAARPPTVCLRVVLIDGHHDPFRLVIPVTIWPSVGTLMTWWVVAYPGIVGLRWRDTLAQGHSVWDVFPQIGADLPYPSGLLILGVIVLVPLRLIGLLMTVGDPGGGDP